MENENTNMQLLNAPEILDKVMSKYPKEANKGYFYLKGWIIEAMEEYVAQFNQENIAGVWVKASERLPESRLYSDNYCCRYVMIPNEYHTWNFAKIKEMVDAAYEVEWLDEHPQPKQQIGYSEEDMRKAAAFGIARGMANPKEINPKKEVDDILKFLNKQQLTNEAKSNGTITIITHGPLPSDEEIKAIGKKIWVKNYIEFANERYKPEQPFEEKDFEISDFAIKSLIEMYKAALNINSADNWISVKDRLPEKKDADNKWQYVLVVYEDESYDTMSLAEFEIDGLLNGVTHWQPLPKPPKP